MRTTFDIYVLFVNGVPKVSNVAATQAKLKNETISVKSDGFSSDQIVLRMSFDVLINAIFTTIETGIMNLI